MPAALPTDPALSKAVKDFGLGPYDGQSDDSGTHGEDSERKEPAGRTLPDDGTKSPQIADPFESDLFRSYPDTPDMRLTMSLPGDFKELFQSHPKDDGDEDEDRVQGVFDPAEHDRALAYPDGVNPSLGGFDPKMIARALQQRIEIDRAWNQLYESFARDGCAHERIAAGELPGDIDGNFQHQHPQDVETLDARVMGVGQAHIPEGDGVDGRDPGAISPKVNENLGGASELPSDEDNEAARTDYYEYSNPVHASIIPGYIAPNEDSGAYTSQAEKTSDSALPGVEKNDLSMDDWLQSLGNWWSGRVDGDASGRQGYPSTDFAENVDFDKSDQDGGGTVSPMGDSRMLAMDQSEWNRKMDEAMKIPDESSQKAAIDSLYNTLREDKKSQPKKKASMNRTATNIPLVNSLTKDFLKACGKKDLTKRHVLAFLQSLGQPQFLSSDIIRCLKLAHDIHVKDVLDEFPVARTASAAGGTTVARVRNKLIDLEGQFVLQPEVASVYRRCAANLTRVLIDMERLETGKRRKADEDPEKCYDGAMTEAVTQSYEEYTKSCEQSGQPAMTHDEWLHGLKADPQVNTHG